MPKRRRTPALRSVPRSAGDQPSQAELWDPVDAAVGGEDGSDAGAAHAGMPVDDGAAQPPPARSSRPSAAPKRPVRGGRGSFSQQALLREQAELLDEVAARRSELDEAEAAAAAARRAWLRSVKAARSKHVTMDAIADVSGVTRAAVYQNLERDRPSRARS
ncbi:hypothetical protein [Candidatus Poriferisodalis sp.]|uniref:hypothetical protein n=1 Tax=Candidatus Poriferisodalis sp. TaxID=3101277 RepID=UPI003B52E9FB